MFQLFTLRKKTSPHEGSQIVRGVSFSFPSLFSCTNCVCVSYIITGATTVSRFLYVQQVVERMYTIVMCTVHVHNHAHMGQKFPTVHVFLLYSCSLSLLALTQHHYVVIFFSFPMMPPSSQTQWSGKPRRTQTQTRSNRVIEQETDPTGRIQLSPRGEGGGAHGFTFTLERRREIESRRSNRTLERLPKRVFFSALAE